MPNTLAHIAVQATAGRAILRPGDFIWCLIGLMIPDVAWIIWRLALIFTQNWAPYAIKLYAIVQGSLFGSLLLCAAIAALARKPIRVFTILAVNCVVHLLLDATQIKWANGVLLGAPFSWNLTQFNLFWPESRLNDFLTIGGLLGCLYFTWKGGRFSFQRQLHFTKATVLLATLFLLLYGVVPPFLWSGALKADNHYVRTLSRTRDRPGKEIELDRVYFKKEDDQLRISTLWGDEFTAKTALQMDSGTISIRGKFLDSHRIEVKGYHIHRSGWRDGASIVGLAWIIFFIGWRRRRNALK